MYGEVPNLYNMVPVKSQYLHLSIFPIISATSKHRRILLWLPCIFEMKSDCFCSLNIVFNLRESQPKVVWFLSQNEGISKYLVAVWHSHSKIKKRSFKKEKEPKVNSSQNHSKKPKGATQLFIQLVLILTSDQNKDYK